MFEALRDAWFRIARILGEDGEDRGRVSRIAKRGRKQAFKSPTRSDRIEYSLKMTRFSLHFLSNDRVQRGRPYWEINSLQSVSIHSCYYYYSLSGSAFFTALPARPPLSSPANLTSRFTQHVLYHLSSPRQERLGNAYIAHADTIIGNVSFVPALFCGFSPPPPSIRRRGRGER